jgi:hypothetical protein
VPSLASPETGLGGMTGQAAGLVGAAATCRYLLSRSCPDAIDRCAGRRSSGSWSLANPSFDLARHAGGCSVFRIFADLGSHPYRFQRGAVSRIARTVRALFPQALRNRGILRCAARQPYAHRALAVCTVSVASNTATR